MRRIADSLVVSPTDLNHFLECEHLTHLDLEVADGRVLTKRRNPDADFLAARGETHERVYLENFNRAGRRVVRIPDPGPASEWTDAAGATKQAMCGGADVIYQGVLIDEGWRGRADFLVKVDGRSA